jgi:hypothetical protein
MKDLSIYDIFPRQEQTPSRVAILMQGHWVFSNVVWSQGVRQSDGATYFYMPGDFGTVLSEQTNPRRLYKRGKPGDYLAYNPAGYYDILSKEEYRLRFPHAYTANPDGVPMTTNMGASTQTPTTSY